MKRVIIAAIFAATVVPTLAEAHEVGLSQGIYTQDGKSFSVELTFASKELIKVLEIDRDEDEKVDAAELEAARVGLEATFVKRLTLDGGAGPCTGGLTKTELAEEDGVSVTARFECPAVGDVATFDAAFISELPHGHRHIARSLVGGSAVETVLFSAKRTLKLSATQPDTGPGLFEMMVIGVEHIVFGWDHLVFLLGLILVGGTLRQMLIVVTAFTVAHSITLGIMSVGIWAPSGAAVEALIAASIVYVGVENFFVKSVEGRWRLTFPFGLIHGFGFAGALADIGLPQDRLIPMLVSFNVGVELGQVAILLLVLPLMMQLWKQAWFTNVAVKVINALIIVAGSYWLIDRVF